MDRRTLKRDKDNRLDLQQQLQAELAAKARIQEQLTEITSQLTEMERYFPLPSICLPSLSCKVHACMYVLAHGLLFHVCSSVPHTWCSRVQQSEAGEKAVRNENEKLKQQLEHAKLGKPLPISTHNYM